jgi:hypothetical protein
MADLKFGNTTPALGDIKVGSNDVSKIYQGTTKVWPSSISGYYTGVFCSNPNTLARPFSASKGLDANGNEVDLTEIFPNGTVVQITTTGVVKTCVTITGFVENGAPGSSKIYTPTMNDFSDCTDCLPNRSYRALVCGTNQVVYVNGYYAFSNRQLIYIDAGEYQVDDVLLARTSSQSNGQCVQITAVGQNNVPTLFFDDDGGTYPVSLCNQCISD